MFDFHRNTKVHKHYTDLLFFCHHRHRAKKEEYRDLLFVRPFSHFLYGNYYSFLCESIRLSDV